MNAVDPRHNTAPLVDPPERGSRKKKKEEQHCRYNSDQGEGIHSLPC
jgi:hypothetical protein